MFVNMAFGGSQVRTYLTFENFGSVEILKGLHVRPIV